MAKDDNRPFAMQLEVEFLARLSEPVRLGQAKSVSEIIRTALERFDFDRAVVARPTQQLISVRLRGATRKSLKRAAKAKQTSVGQLVRLAVESYLPQLESATAGQMEMSIPAAQPAATGTASASRSPSRRAPRPAATGKKKSPVAPPPPSRSTKAPKAKPKAGSPVRERSRKR